MNRCSNCTASLDFYGISLQKRGPDVLWSRWTNCPNCGQFAAHDENGMVRSTQKQEPPKTLFIPVRERHE
jgi:hypothetical protein